MLNIDKIDTACNYSKLKYSEMENHFDSNKIGEIDPKDKFIIMYDMSYILSFLDSISNIDKKSNITDSEYETKIIMRLVYGILNSVAHYRHYTTSKLKRKSVIILYSSDPSYYIRYDNTFKKINKILNLFRKTIFIERLEDETKFIYQHMTYFTAMNIMSLNNSVGIRCRIIYVGNNPLAMQLLRIDRDMTHIKHKYIDCGPDIFFNLIGLHDKTDNLYKNIDLITPVLSLFGFNNGYPKLDSIKGKRISKLYSILADNCKDFVDKDDYQTIVTGMGLDQKDINLFGLRLKSLDVDYHNKTFALSKTLLKIWGSKIQSNAIHSFNDFFKFEDDMNLNVQWLLG